MRSLSTHLKRSTMLGLWLAISLTCSVSRTRAFDDLRRVDVVALLERIHSRKPIVFGKSKRFDVNEQNEIISLRLARLKLIPKDIETISKLARLRTLDLSQTNISDEQLGQLGRLENLRSLKLFDTSITDLGLASLRMKVQLESLSLGRTKISSAGLRICKTLPNLRVLDLYGTKISSESLKHLLGLRKLQSLKLGDSQIDDSAVIHLLQLKSLRGLTLDRTRVSPQGIQRLAATEAFTWIKTPESAVDELLRRMEESDRSGVEMMTSIGLELPRTGKFKRLKVSPVAGSKSDQQRNRKRYEVELKWEVEGRKPSIFHATLLVDRGTTSVLQMGIQ